MNNVTITIELANAILNYLAERPFKEVQGLIGQLMQQANASKEAQQETN